MKRQPIHANGMQWYVLSVNPVPWAVGEVGIAANRPGGRRIYMRPNLDLKTYQEAVREEIAEWETTCWAAELHVVFVFQRALDDIVRGKNKSRAHQADTTNMQKATEDALQGILFSNDNQNRVVTSIIKQQDELAEPCVAIGIGMATASLVYDLVPNLVRKEIEALEP